MPSADNDLSRQIKAAALMVPMAAGLGMTASFLMLAQDLRETPDIRQAALTETDLGQITFLGQPPRDGHLDPPGEHGSLMTHVPADIVEPHDPAELDPRQDG